MPQKQLQAYFQKHRKRVQDFMGRYLSGESSPEVKLFDDLLDGYTILENLIHVQEEAYEKKVKTLQERVSTLEKRLHLNPENSHKPPSSSRFKKIKNQREKSGRKPGAQAHHKGASMPVEECVDQVTRHEPTRCRSCGRDLNEVADSEVLSWQVVDLKNGKKHVHEHQRVTKFCPDCGDMNRGEMPGELSFPRSRRLFGPHLKAVATYFYSYQLIPVLRTQEILNDLYGIEVSAGTLCNFSKEISEKLFDWELEIKAQLRASKVLHADETGIRCEKRSDWVHVHSTEELTLLSHHKSRGREAHQEIGVLPEYPGHLVSDGFKTYDNYECQHSYCNAHILRELKYIHEEENEKWAKEMSDFLKKTLHHVHQGSVKIEVVWRQYANILKRGFRECGFLKELQGRPPDYYKFVYIKGKRIREPRFRRRKLSRGMNLLQRLRDQREKILAFVENPRVPFTNNQAERDLRMIRLKEKISGCFRSSSMAKTFCRIRSFISTMQKQNIPLLDSLTLVQILDL